MVKTKGDLTGWGSIESGISNVVFVGIAINFLLSIETKVKRKRALIMIHQLRSVAHVVDMSVLYQVAEDALERIIQRLDSTQPDRS